VTPSGLHIPNAIHVVPQDTPQGKYTHSFRIYNARPWFVSLEAKADCGCSGMSWTKNKVAPMSWRQIQVSFKNSGENSSVILFETSAKEVLSATVKNPP